jgi:ribosome-binding protein aMBF1 (putative translation factor)
METTFEQFINSSPRAKELFEKEYNELLLTELLLEKMEAEKLSVEALAQMAKVSPTVIRKIKNSKVEKVNFGEFTDILNTLGYRLNIEKK